MGHACTDAMLLGRYVRQLSSRQHRFGTIVRARIFCQHVAEDARDRCAPRQRGEGAPVSAGSKLEDL